MRTVKLLLGFLLAFPAVAAAQSPYVDEQARAELRGIVVCPSRLC